METFKMTKINEKKEKSFENIFPASSQYDEP